MQKEQNPAKSQTRYLEMFKSYIFYYSWILKINGEITSSIDINKPANVADINKALEKIRNEVRWVRKTFVTDEQKIYMLKTYRSLLFVSFIHPEEWRLDNNIKNNPEYIKLLPTLKKIYEYNEKILKEIFQPTEPDDYSHISTSYWEKLIKDVFEHNMIVARQNNIEENLYRKFSGQKINKLVKDLEEAEINFLEKRKSDGFILFPSKNLKLFLKIDDKWSWYLSDDSYCELTAELMGHCGNVNGDEGDRILHLGESHEKGFKPHLTFIINDGLLGETKGKHNSKPDKKYHPQIVRLLLDNRIIYNLGGGYKHENNFHLNDLDELQYNYLKNLRPDLFSLSEAIKVHPILREKLFLQYGIDFKMEKDKIRLIPISIAPAKISYLNKLTLNNYFSPFLNTKEKRRSAWLFDVASSYDQGFTEHLTSRDFDELINSLNKENEVLLKKVLKKLKANKNIDNYEIYDNHPEIVSAIEQAVGAMYEESVRSKAEKEIIALLDEKAEDFGIIIDGGRYLEDYVKFYLDIDVIAKKIEEDSMPNQSYFLEFLEEIIFDIKNYKNSIEPEYEEESFNHHAEYYLSQILEE